MKLVLVLIVTLVPMVSFASGYGWYVSSFDWRTYQNAQPIINTKLLEIARKAEPTLSHEDQIDMAVHMALSGCCHWLRPSELEEWPLIKPLVPLREESPQELEFYWPDALHHASRRVSRSGYRQNYFLLFQYGRSLVSARRPNKCESGWNMGGATTWGYCLDAAFILAPEEVATFHEQVARLNSTTKHPSKYRDYLLHLEKVLSKNNNGKRGLLFQGHD